MLIPLIGGIIKPGFTCSVKTDNAGTSTSTQFKFPVIAIGEYNCVIDWGDGTSSAITTFADAAWTHTYSVAGTYTIVVRGLFKGLQFNAGGDRLKLLNISAWGSLQIISNAGIGGYFSGCSNLTVTAQDILDTNSCNFMTQFFLNCTSLTTVPNFNLWNHSLSTAYGNCFASCVNFNMTINISAPLAGNIGNFFDGCSIFNSPVTINAPLANSYSAMFRNNLVMNSAVSLNSTRVTRCDNTFNNARAFNQPVNNLGSFAFCTRMDGMFSNAIVFDQDVSFFIIGGTTTMTGMFAGSGFTITNYNKLLDSATGWPSQASIKNSVVFSAGTAHYSGANAIAGRSVLTSGHTWTITDGGTP